MNEPRVSENLVARVLAEVENVLARDVGAPVSFLPADRIDNVLRTVDCWDEIDFADVIECIERRFGFHCADSEWDELLGTSLTPAGWEAHAENNFTFRSLAVFIAERLETVTIEPVSILGSRCAQVGAFRAVEAVARELAPDTRRFAPSTRLRKRFHGERLETLWARIRWITGGRIPELQVTLLTTMTMLTGMIGMLACMVSPLALCTCYEYIDGVWLDIAFGAIPAGIALLLVSLILHKLDNRLPIGIATFRDLAERMVAGPSEMSAGSASEHVR